MGPQMTSLFDITWQFQTSWLQEIPINVSQVENAVKNENIKDPHYHFTVYGSSTLQ